MKSFLTHLGLATPYGDICLGQHWFRQWLVAWRHQAITWFNVDVSSVKSCGIHRRALSWEDLKIDIRKTKLKMTFVEWHLDFPGTNELNKIDVNMNTGPVIHYCYSIALWIIADIVLDLNYRNAVPSCYHPKTWDELKVANSVEYILFLNVQTAIYI